ncbi:MAG: methyl-accepting chemotaxis protein [Colwellia sp.]|nr:methyl-accepting chemotaxis protein [Colwellia sp.]
MLNNFTIIQKFIFISVLLSLMIVLLTTVNAIRLNTMAHHIESIEIGDIPLTKNITLITEHQLEQEIYFERAFRYALESKEEAHAQEGYEHAKDEYHKYDEKVTKEIKQTEQLIAYLLKRADDKKIIKEYRHLNKVLVELEKQHGNWTEHVKGIFNFLEQGDIHQAIENSVKVEAEALALEHKVTGLLNEIEEFTERAIIELDHEEKQIMRDGIIFSIISILITTFFTFFNVKSIKASMSKLTYSVSELFQGNLANSFNSSRISKDLGEILADIEGVREKMFNIVGTIHNSSDEVVSVTDNLNVLTKEVLHNIEQQSSEVNMLSIALEEMEATSADIAKNSEISQESTAGAKNFTDISQSDMNEAISSMSQLNSSIETSSENITALDHHGQKIASVLDVIKSIADQTNLLALNAAIEAARAGEQGRGFAVVADEVRTLAQRTQESTTEIEEMINAFQKETVSAVSAMKKSKQFAQSMLETANKSQSNLLEITHSVNNINDMTMQIASAAEEQAVTVNELNKNLTSLSELSDSNVNSSSQVSVASEQISNVAKQLKIEISYFNVG